MHRRADVQSARLGRSLLVVAVLLPGCGSTLPTAPSTPATPPLTGRVELSVDPRTARLMADANGGPGVVHYEPCFVVGYGGVLGATKTVQKVEDWLIGPDGTTYRYQVLDDWVPELELENHRVSERRAVNHDQIGILFDELIFSVP